MKSRLCHKPTFSRLTTYPQGMLYMCVSVCAVVEASQSERKERLGVSNVKNSHLVASGAPSISAHPGAPFISRLCPEPSGAAGKIKAK